MWPPQRLFSCGYSEGWTFMNFSPVLSLSLLQVNSHLSHGAGLDRRFPGNQENGGEGRGTCKRRNSTSELSWCRICCRLGEMHGTKIQIIYIMGPLIKKYMKRKWKFAPQTTSWTLHGSSRVKFRYCPCFPCVFFIPCFDKKLNLILNDPLSCDKINRWLVPNTQSPHLKTVYLTY